MKTNTRAIIGAAGWGGFVVAVVPTLQDAAWAHALLVFAALVLMPFVLDLAVEENESHVAARLFAWARAGQLPAAALLAFACAMKTGGVAALLALPWAALTVVLAVTGVLRIKHEGWGRALDRQCGDIAFIYSAIGGAWVLVDRTGLRPLGFDPAIVTLTAVHFHYAGLLLPLFAGLVQRRLFFSRAVARAVVGVLLGVPAVAIGITTTQLGYGPAFETAAGCGLALAGMAVGVLQVRLATDTVGAPFARALLGISGASLFFAMLLAGLYAMRAFAAPFPWLDLPAMRALHGTINALGFGLCGVLGWRAIDQRPGSS